MAIALVGNSAAGGSYAATRTQPFTSTAGNALLLVVLHQGQTITSIADTGGNVWTLAADSATAGAPSQYQVAIYYCLNAKAITSVTVTCPATTAIVTNVSQWSGVAALRSAIGKYTATGGSPTTPTTVAAGAGDLVIAGGAYYNATQAETVAAPFTAMNDGGVSTTQMAVAYAKPTATGNYGPAWTQPDATKPFGSVTAAFAPAADTATVTVTAAGETATTTYTIPPTDPVVQPPAAGGWAPPTGPGYTQYADLGVTSMQAAINKIKAMGANYRTTLVMPEGVFKFNGQWDANSGALDATCPQLTGLLGSGYGTIFEFPAGFVTDTSRITTTNPYHSIMATGGNFKEIGNFYMRGNAGQLHGAVKITATGLKVWPTKMVNCCPGDDDTNPGETFGYNWYRCNGVEVWGFDGDGQDNASSLLAGNSSTDIVYHDCVVRNAKYGMPTVWQCDGYTTYDFQVIGCKIGLNMEQVGGEVRHYRPVLKPNRTQAGSNTAMHATFQSNQSAHVASILEIFDPVVDTGLHGGCFTLMSSKNYTVGNASGTQLQKTGYLGGPNVVHVYQGVDAAGNPNELKMVDTDSSYTGTRPATPDPTKHWYLHR